MLIGDCGRWPGQDSNLRATDYESAALPLSYRAPGASDAITGGWEADACGTLPPMPLILADQALGQTLALLVTFVGVGIFVNILVAYIIIQVLGERKQNREPRAGADEL